jgi:alpha-beta hydrolase superfamily lysophospholipase
MTGPFQECHGYLEGVGRLRLHYRAWEAAAPRSAVLLVHGLAEHSARYTGFGHDLVGAGHSVYALDLRGHGDSDGRRGHVRRFDQLLQDLDRFRREVHGMIRPDVPMFLVGHSLGGLIALRYLEEYADTFSGAVLSAPWLATALAIPHWKVAAAQVLTRLAPSLPMKANIPSDQLSHDPAIAAAFRSDPLVHDRITPRMFTEISTAMGLVFQRADRIDLPLLFLLPGGDTITDTERTRALARSIRQTDVTVRFFPEAYHELFNELDRTIVLSELRGWLAARIRG